MRPWIPGVVLCSVLLGASAQEPSPERAQDPKAGAEAAPSAEELIAQLGDASFRTRTKAERALRSMGKDALPALRRAAADDSDAEVQWRARRLVRQIEQGDEGGLVPRPDRGRPGEGDAPRGGVRTAPWRQERGATPFDDVQRRFDEVFRGLERDFGMDIPRGRFFEDGFFQDLENQMREMQQRMQQMQNGIGGRGQSMSMQIGPEGVRVEQRVKNEKGEDEVKVYEAPDLQTFREKYPGVLETNGLGNGGFRLFLGDGANGSPFGGFPDPFGGPGAMGPGAKGPGADGQGPDGQGGGRWFFGYPPQRGFGLAPNDGRRVLPPGEDLGAPPPAGKRLGVIVRPEIPPEVRDYVGLEPGVGLMVESVQDGTLAEALGVQARDIVLRIGGKTIGSSLDVQAALGAIEAGGKVEVVVLRGGKETKLSGVKPATDGTPKDGKDDQGEDGLRPRRKVQIR